MKKTLIKNFLGIAVCLITLTQQIRLHAHRTEIIKLNTVTQIDQHTKPNKKNIIIFDIDNTIAEPIKTIGSDQWFSHMIKTYTQQGYQEKDAIDRAIKLYHHVHNHLDMQPTEPEMSSLITALQQQKTPVIALTARSFIDRTFEQLKNLAIDFIPTAPTDESITFNYSQPAIYRQGIIFCGNNNKGTVLCDFFDRTGYQPEHVIFVDDKEKNIIAVQEELKKRNISFLGVHYTQLDEKVANFNGAQADAELAELLEQHPFPSETQTATSIKSSHIICSQAPMEFSTGSA